MTNLHRQIFLSNTKDFCPQSADSAYQVISGTVRVYIVPNQDGDGKRLFLCEVSEGSQIPAFVYKCPNHRHWRFRLIAKSETALLEHIPGGASKSLRKSFLQFAGITTERQEGFEDSLAELYKQEELKDRVFLLKAQKAISNEKSIIYSSLVDAFSYNVGLGVSDNPTYLALCYACSKTGIPLISPDLLLTRCGRNPDIFQIARASKFICRNVTLEPNWHQTDCGCLIGSIGSEIVACILEKNGKYMVYRTSNDKIYPITEDLARKISPKAYSIGRTLPLKEVKTWDLLQFCTASICARDLIPTAVLTLVCALIGVLLPTLNQMIYDEYIPLGNVGYLMQLCGFMLSFMLGNICFSIVKNLFDSRVTSRIGHELQNAAYHRLFHLPESFFREYDSTDMGSRVMQVGSITSTIAHAFLITGISTLFSVVYLIRMTSYSRKLTWISLVMYLVYILLSVILTALARSGEIRIAEAEAEAASILYQQLNGAAKIRMSGSENRAHKRYEKPYHTQIQEEQKVNRLISAKETISSVVFSLFSMVLYSIIVNQEIGLSVGSFVAFNTAFGAFAGSLESFIDELLVLYQQQHAFKRISPIFQTVPEDTEAAEIPGNISGKIEFKNVSFKYSSNTKNTIDNISLTVEPGDYVAIVGSSGCGKSTLLKLLLGFESPQSGSILIGGRNLQSLDKSDYRRQLGVVLQNDKLISGSILENITIAAPNATMSQILEVIDQVGLKEDISNMPMGLQTILNETSGTISGGQQQRILIARAILSSPKILIFDEATSALDNITQKAVSDTLDKMNITRIVIAHRLSTIKNCKHILVLNKTDHGAHIEEEGTYKELITKKGLFYNLAKRQLIRSEEEDMPPLNKKIENDTILYSDDSGIVLTIKESINAAEIRVVLDGELRSVVANDLRDELDAVIPFGYKIMLDMSKVTYLSSAVIDALLTVQQHIKEFGKAPMYIQNIPNAILQKLQSFGLDGRLDP